MDRTTFRFCKEMVLLSQRRVIVAMPVVIFGLNSCTVRSPTKAHQLWARNANPSPSFDVS